MEITIQPLITALKSKKFYFRLSQPSEESYSLVLGTTLKTKSLAQRMDNLIAGTESVIKEIEYLITDKEIIKTGRSNKISMTDIKEVEKLIGEAFSFRDRNHVTKWKD